MIRAACADDSSSIASLWNAAITGSLATFTTEPKQTDDIARLLDGPCLVAEMDGSFAGFASYGPFRSGPGYTHTAEVNIYLETRAQGLGLGRDLLSALESVARDHAIRVLVAAISSANPGAARFHAACGFAQAGVIKEAGRKWDQWLDLILMEKRLVD